MQNVRTHLTRQDISLVVAVLATARRVPASRLEATVASEGVDVLLDDPHLPTAMQRDPRGGAAREAVFVYVIVRHALLATGLSDRDLSAYVASMVAAFGRRGRAERLAEYDDAAVSSLAELALQLEHGERSRRLLARVHLGNLALWRSGLFPEWVTTQQRRRGGPDRGYYEALGAYGYRAAATHPLVDPEVGAIYQLAADAFPDVRRALNRASDQYWFPHNCSTERMLRQVGDRFSAGASAD